MASNDISSTDLFDKRRNKLGYHRTSVACGHCRRRKIRCLIAPDDQQGRCSNCIRLKKECNFYPVDQQPLPERALRYGSGAESPPNDLTTSASSSPVYRAGGSMSEQADHHHGLQAQRPQISHREQGLYPSAGSSTSPSGRTAMPGANLAFPQDFGMSPTWDQPQYLGHSPQSFSTIDESSGSVWGSNTSPITGNCPAPQYSSHSPSLPITPSSQSSRSAFSSRGGRADEAWNHASGQARHMSIVTQQQGLPAQYHARAVYASPIGNGHMSTAPGIAASSLYLPPSQDTSACGAGSEVGVAGFGGLSLAGHPGDFADSQWQYYPHQPSQHAESGAGDFPRQSLAGLPVAGQAHKGIHRSRDSQSQYGPPNHRLYPR